MQDDKERLPKLLEYVLCLIHLAVFGILGVTCTIYMHTPFFCGRIFDANVFLCCLIMYV